MTAPIKSTLILALLVPQFLLTSWAGPNPLPINEAETANYRWLRKPVFATRLLDNMETTNTWSHFGVGQMTLTPERAKDGQQSLRLSSPTKPNPPYRITGRPFGECGARRSVADEDWTGYNRLSFWVYPHLPGFKVITLLVKLHNTGATKVPDSYNREGLNYFLLKPDQWNQVVWEIPHLARDKVTGLDFIYRLQGNEPGATNVVCFDIDQLELQRVEADHFEGWEVAPGKIAYSHSGYQLNSPKTALASGLTNATFDLIEKNSGKVVLTKPVEKTLTLLGEFQTMSFSEITTPGIYRLAASSAQTPWFAIGADVWRESIVKTINFFYTERCGFPIPGIHDLCHQDWQAEHNGRKISINGGWHDAGDLSQGLVNTAESAYAMLALADAVRESDPALSRQLIDEARWGLEWLEKTRFGDGFRLSWATMDYWTDGVLGTADDTLGDARNSPFDNFLATATEGLAARVLKGSDPALAERYLKLAREDAQFAGEKVQSGNVELVSAMVQASLVLYQATGASNYADHATTMAKILLQSQQREYTDWAIPLTGFFYTSTKRDRILHYFHRSHEQAPIVALAGLCEALPNHPDWMEWYAAVALYSEYLKRIAQFDEPYGMLPASVYSVDESNDPRFQEQVRNGVKLSEKYYLRRFPVWFDFRGNCGTGLSQTKALSAAACLRGDTACAELVQKQLQWTVGRNPFCQSLMYGEGHDYAPQYTSMSGDLVGSLPVGIQTKENHDLPYWPAANCYNYKEVWVHPSARWLGIMADVLAPKPAVAPLPFELSQTTKGDTVQIKLTAKARGRHTFTLRAYNLALPNPEQSLDFADASRQTLTWTARIKSTKEPWFAVVSPDGQLSARKEIGKFFDR